MKNDIIETANAIEMYMHLVINTNIMYMGIEETTQFLKLLDFTDIDVVWYDGNLFSATRNGIVYTSVFCNRSHSFRLDAEYYVEIKKLRKIRDQDLRENHLSSEYDHDIRYYRNTENRAQLIDISVDLYWLQTKLLLMCRELSDSEVIYVPRIYSYEWKQEYAESSNRRSSSSNYP